MFIFSTTICAPFVIQLFIHCLFISFKFAGIKQFVNHNLHNIKTPVNAIKLGELLTEANYPEEEVKFLVVGFTIGFDISYEGPKIRKSRSRNIPFTTGVGDKI